MLLVNLDLGFSLCNLSNQDLPCGLALALTESFFELSNLLFASLRSSLLSLDLSLSVSNLSLADLLQRDLLFLDSPDEL